MGKKLKIVPFLQEVLCKNFQRGDIIEASDLEGFFKHKQLSSHSLPNALGRMATHNFLLKKNETIRKCNRFGRVIKTVTNYEFIGDGLDGSNNNGD